MDVLVGCIYSCTVHTHLNGELLPVRDLGLLHSYAFNVGYYANTLKLFVMVI